MKKYLISSLFFFLNVFSYAQWQPNFRLTTDPSVSYLSYTNAHCLAVNGDNLHVVWWDGRDLDREIYYKRSTDNGLTWQQDTRLTNVASWSEYPSIAVSGSTVHIVWMDDRDESFYPEIYYKHSTDYGSTWETEPRITNNTADSENSFVVTSDSAVHLIWQDNPANNDDIYYKKIRPVIFLQM